MDRRKHWETVSALSGIVWMLLAGWAYAGTAKDILDAASIKGGLIVHVGCGDGKLTAALRANDSYIVQGLDADAKNVQKAREHIRALKHYGKVSVDKLSGKSLPYIDNLVNLVVSEDLGGISLDEVMRVLCPRGVAYVRRAGKWTKTVKPWPKELDEWTHYLHGPDNNPVANDTVVGPPQRLQWTGGPKWGRHHDHMASLSTMVSANGRIFHIMDEGPVASIRLPSKWRLTARDAFNGTVLWKRAIARWWPHLYPLKSGPALLPRRLVAQKDRVYATLGIAEPVSSLDAATGKTVATYEQTAGAEEIIASNGTLFVIVNPAPSEKLNTFHQETSQCWQASKRRRGEFGWSGQEKWLMAIDPETGRTRWEKKRAFTPLSMAVDGVRVYCLERLNIVAFDRRDGREIWRSQDLPVKQSIGTDFGPTLVLHQGVILLFGGGTDRAFVGVSAKTGKFLWQQKLPRSGHFSPEDILCIDGLAWAGDTASSYKRSSGKFFGFDVHNGQIKKQFPMDVDPNVFVMHQRCYRAKATTRYLLPSRIGIEYVDPKEAHWDINHWVRSGCLYGIMPCNGLTYTAPHSCACYMQSLQKGFCALAARKPAGASQPTLQSERLEKGPAYGRVRPGAARADEWPTYRHDAARSGFTTSPASANLTRSWKTSIGGKLSSPIVAQGKVFVASIEDHRLHAMDVSSGEPIWTYTAGGRIDSPPSLYKGHVLFGSRDGHVHCLRASDGLLVWRFRAAPEIRVLMSYGQLESVWPVHGSVLVQDGTLYCVAGRSAFLDGGMRFLRLNPQTGEKLSETVLDRFVPDTGKDLHSLIQHKCLPVAKPDILSSDGRYVYMRAQQFDLAGRRTKLTRGPFDHSGEGSERLHLFCPIGFLDGSWWHRAYWLYGSDFDEGWGEWYRNAWSQPAGRILVYDDTHVYGYGREPKYLCNSSVLEYRLFSAVKKVRDSRRQQISETKIDGVNWRKQDNLSESAICAVDYKWKWMHPPVLVRAMVLARDILFVSGPPDVVDEKKTWGRSNEREVHARLAEQAAAFEGKKGGMLYAVSATDGERIREIKLDCVPVFDGMAAAGGRLYISAMDGSVVCYVGK